MLRQRLLCEVDVDGRRFPVHAYHLGSSDAQAPAVAYVGGVHGLERIGAEVVIAYLRSLVMRLRWDETLHRQLEAMCLVFVPLLNPGGLWRGTRANPNGVDLMRNAPQDAEEPVPWLVGGQRLSAALPWYRGARDAAMERESLVDNEFTASSYRVVHFVADMPIRLSDARLAAAPPAAWTLGRIIFVMAEFQVLDTETDARNEVGDASHSAYKVRQRTAVMRRLKLGKPGVAVPSERKDDD